MTDHDAHGYEDEEPEGGWGTVLTMEGPFAARRGGLVEPERVVDLTGVQPAPQLENITSTPPTTAAGLFALARAVERLAAAVEKRGRPR